MPCTDLYAHPIHLGRAGSALAEPAFGGDLDGVMAYADRHADDGAEGRIVTMMTFTELRSVWEMHPA